MRAAVAGIKDNYNETAITIGAQLYLKKVLRNWFCAN
jgi:predicted GNAT family N-acyltransferase